MSVVSTQSGIISYGSPSKLTHYASECSLLSRKGIWMVTLEFHHLYSWLLDSLLAKPARPMTCRPPGMSSLFLLNLILLCSSISHRQQCIHFHLNKPLGVSPSQLGSKQVNVMKTESEFRVGRAGLKCTEWILIANTQRIKNISERPEPPVIANGIELIKLNSNVGFKTILVSS